MASCSNCKTADRLTYIGEPRVIGGEFIERGDVCTVRHALDTDGSYCADITYGVLRFVESYRTEGDFWKEWQHGQEGQEAPLA